MSTSRVRKMADPEIQSPEDRIPTTVLTGFLGAGKTTLLNHLLTENHGKRICVIENEFGEVDVDGHLVAGQEDVDGTMVEVLNGCVCCTVRGDLSTALVKLFRENRAAGKKKYISSTTSNNLSSCSKHLLKFSTLLFVFCW